MDGNAYAPHINSMGGYGGGYGGFGCGFGGGGFLEAILLLAIVGGGNGGGLFGGNNAVNAANMNQISTDFLLTWLNQELNGVECKLDNIDRDVLQSTTLLDKDILGTANQTQKAICDASFANLLGQKDQMFATQQGFCGVTHGMDKMGYDNLLNTNTIVGAINCGNQRIIDWLNCNEMKEKDQKINTLEMINFKNEIIASQKPIAPVPAYIQPSPYEYYYPNFYANNGYSNGGNCGNNCNPCGAR